MLFFSRRLSLVLLSTAILSIGLYKLQEDIRGVTRSLRKSVPEIVKDLGYPLEEHFVTTLDGYILCVHRIPHGHKEAKGSAHGPILLGHGSVMGSTGFLLGNPEDYLGYVLADNGYDVWLINNRGNSFSRNSTRLSPVTSRSKEFWDFGFEELSLLDYPVVIDYILKRTKEKSLFFLGISQGCAQILALLSEQPEYNEKIRAGILLSPALYVNQSSLLPFRFGFMGTAFKYVSENVFGVYECWMWKDFLLWGAHRFCSPGGLFHTTCPALGSIIYGHTTFDYNELPAIADLIFQGSSYRSWNHFIQWYTTGDFKKYDFGSEEANFQRYGTPIPPTYDLSKVTARMHLVLGRRDELVVLEDGLRILKELRGSVKASKKILLDYTHTDFVSSLHSKKRLFPHILKYLRKIP